MSSMRLSVPSRTVSSPRLLFWTASLVARAATWITSSAGVCCSTDARTVTSRSEALPFSRRRATATPLASVVARVTSIRTPLSGSLTAKSTSLPSIATPDSASVTMAVRSTGDEPSAGRIRELALRLTFRSCVSFAVCAPSGCPPAPAPVPPQPDSARTAPEISATSAFFMVMLFIWIPLPATAGVPISWLALLGMVAADRP